MKMAKHHKRILRQMPELLEPRAYGADVHELHAANFVTVHHPQLIVRREALLTKANITTLCQRAKELGLSRDLVRKWWKNGLCSVIGAG